MTDLAAREMDAEEARLCVDRIRHHAGEVRHELQRLHDRRGWAALNYDSMEDCAEKEFGWKRSYMYYVLRAAETERELSTIVDGTPMPPLREYHLRQIAELPPDEQRAVALELASGGGLTIKDHRRIIAAKQRDAPPRAHSQIPSSAVALGEHCRIELGDARQLPLADGEAHLVITSPPYNARVAYIGYEDWLPWEDYWHGLIEPSLREAYRVLCDGGRLCLNLPNVVRQDVKADGAYTTVGYRSNSGRKWKAPGAGGRPWSALVEQHLYPLATDVGFLTRERIQWVKGADPEMVTTPSTAWGTWCSAENPVMRAVGEPIYVFSKGRYDRDPGVSDIDPEEFKSWTRNVWFVPAIGLDSTAFPASYPEEIPRRLAKLYSYTADLVVDPFLGSGTTAVAAAKLGRHVFGCDISAHSVELARARVAREVARA